MCIERSDVFPSSNPTFFSRLHLLEYELTFAGYLLYTLYTSALHVTMPPISGDMSTGTHVLMDHHKSLVNGSRVRTRSQCHPIYTHQPSGLSNGSKPTFTTVAHSSILSTKENATVSRSSLVSNTSSQTTEMSEELTQSTEGYLESLAGCLEAIDRLPSETKKLLEIRKMQCKLRALLGQLKDFSSVQPMEGRPRHLEANALLKRQDCLDHHIDGAIRLLCEHKPLPLLPSVTHEPSTSGTHPNTRDIPFEDTSAVMALSKNAIMEKLLNIEELISEIGRDLIVDNFRTTLYMWFRRWWEPDMFAEELNSYYKAPDVARDRQAAIILLVERWTSVFWEADDQKAVRIIRRLMGKVLHDNDSWEQTVTNVLKKLETCGTRSERHIKGSEQNSEEVSVTEFMPYSVAFLDFRKTASLRRRDYRKVSILDFIEHCDLLAQQLTLRELLLYHAMTPRDIANAIIFRKDDNYELAENKLKSHREFGNKLLRLAKYLVLSELTPQRRAEVFGFLVDLAQVGHLHLRAICFIDVPEYQACLKLRNYSAAFTVYNGLEAMGVSTRSLCVTHGVCLFNTLAFTYFLILLFSSLAADRKDTHVL